MFELTWVPAIKVAVLGVITLLLIPKDRLRHYLVYGLILGGFLDIVIVIAFTNIHLIRYKNFDPFGVFGVMSLFTPIAWALAFAIFFFLLPRKKLVLIPFIFTYSFFGYSLGLVLENLNTFEYIGWWHYGAPFFIFLWFAGAAWVYLHLENGEHEDTRHPQMA